MDQRNLNVEDLVSNESFIDWVKRSDPEAVKYWDLYIASHPEIQSKVDQARILILNLKSAQETGSDSAQVESIWNNIRDRVEHHTSSPKVSSPKSNWAVAIASVSLVCAVVALSLVFFKPQEETVSSTNIYYQHTVSDFIERVNDTDKDLAITMADGSTVTLDPGSRLKYTATFSKGSTRQVYLLGQAFFDVVKNPYKPFIVHSNEIEVTVLGTSFRVDSPENGEDIRVSVKTGRVSVLAVPDDASGTKTEGVILLPNQQVIYERRDRLFEKTLVEVPELLGTSVITSGDFEFENTPIADVFQTIETAYGVEIIFDEEVMKNCFITAPLGAEPMREKLKIICQTIGANYEIIDANVVIRSTGCK